MKEELIDCQHCGFTHREGYNCKDINKSASAKGSTVTAGRINKKISRILLDAIGGHEKEYRTEDGFIKWGKVEREMHYAVNSELP